MRKSTFRQRAMGLGAACLLAFSASAAAGEVWLGLGYDRVYNGHGFDLHKLGDVYILYFYTYDQDGNPEWVLGLAQMDGGVLAGTTFAAESCGLSWL